MGVLLGEKKAAKAARPWLAGELAALAALLHNSSAWHRKTYLVTANPLTHDVRTYWQFHKFHMSFNDLVGGLPAIDVCAFISARAELSAPFPSALPPSRRKSCLRPNRKSFVSSQLKMRLDYARLRHELRITPGVPGLTQGAAPSCCPLATPSK